MEQFSELYAQEVEHTKNKIYEDIQAFFEKKETLPSLEEYLTERGHYIEQIWINVWLNSVTNKVSKNNKKSFLKNRGFEVEGVDRKLINKLFRIEMRSYQPFDTLAWIYHTFKDNLEDWEKRYHEARSIFFIRQEEERVFALKEKEEKEFLQAVNETIHHHHESIYLHIRHFIAKKVKEHLKTKAKYQTIDPFMLEEKLVVQGNFNESDYVKLADFLKELTGDIHKTLQWGRSYFEYERYYDLYERLIIQKLQQLLPKVVKEYFPKYEGNNLQIMQKDSVQIFELVNDFENELEQEYLSDLLKIATMDFEEEEQREIYRRDLTERDKKKAEELAELRRIKEEEERRMEEIFSQVYNPSIALHTRFFLHVGETNTGKTHRALERMKQAKSGLYLAPLRLLALEVYDKLNREGVPCGLKTGEEEKEVEGANHISSTVEMFHEKDFYDVMVIDEAQMIADKDRGFSWYKAITRANAHEVHIIGSKNVKSIILQILGECDIEIHEYVREIPLEVESKVFEMKHTRKGDALVCFSRKRVLETASHLQNNGHSVSMIYGSMPPETRKKQIERFIKGETKVVVATDAIGMGLNLPIRRIVFLENEKFDGTRRRTLTSQEVKQIAGRAGRKGLYNIGKVAFTNQIKEMTKLLLQEDAPVDNFAIAPTNAIFERFQKYYYDLGTFFDLWNKFESPEGTKKASLQEERELYELIRDTEIEARLSMMDLYGFLHLPFSKKESALIEQWIQAMQSIIEDSDLPEPRIKTRNLEELELTYKSIGLHLLFLYRLNRKTEAIYWERIREEIADGVHERLKKDVETINKKCKHCDRFLPRDFNYAICNSCHRKRRSYSFY